MVVLNEADYEAPLAPEEPSYADEGELLGRQAQIERVHHRAHARHGEVELEMAVVVPGQRGHPVAGLDAEAGERVAETPHAGDEIAVGVAMCARGLFGHDLLGRVQPLHPPDDVVHRQRKVLNQTFPCWPPSCSVVGRIAWRAANYKCGLTSGSASSVT